MNHIPMRLKNREVTNVDFIEAILKMIPVCHLGLIDDDGYPYVIPVNYGYERKDDCFVFYFHFAKAGHKIDLLRQNNHVCMTFSAFSDFPDQPYQNHRHDFRSVIAKGDLQLVDGDQFELYMHAHEKLQTTNHREFNYEERAKKLPPMYMAVVTCPLRDVRAKSEFPLTSLADVPLHQPQ